MARKDAGDQGQTADAIVGPFRVTLATSDADRTDEYRLRYEVFVEECRFLSGEGCVGRQERDEFDEGSCAFLLRDAESGEIAACQRLILPDRLPAGTITNFEREYQPLASGPHLDLATAPRGTWAEVSRTTVAPKYRWGGSAAALPAIVVMKYASIALSIAFGRSALFSLSEPAIVRLIRRLGFEMVQVGALVEFHGRRAPFRMDVDDIVRSVRDNDRPWLDRLIHAALRLPGTTRRPGSGPARVA